MLLSQVEEPLEKKGLVFQLFGEQNSELSRKAFVRNIATFECNWIFDVPEIRHRLNDHFLKEEFLESQGF